MGDLKFLGLGAMAALCLSCGNRAAVPAPTEAALARQELLKSVVIVEAAAPLPVPSLQPGAETPDSVGKPASPAASAAAAVQPPFLKIRRFQRRSLHEGAGSRADRLTALLAELAADPEVGAVVLVFPPRGAAEAVRTARAARPSLLFLALAPEEDPLLIESSLDLAADTAPLPEGDAAAAVPLSAELSEALAEGLAEHAYRVVRAGSRIDGLKDLLAALKTMAPAGEWKAEYRQDPATGIPAKNHVLIRTEGRD